MKNFIKRHKIEFILLLVGLTITILSLAIRYPFTAKEMEAQIKEYGYYDSNITLLVENEGLTLACALGFAAGGILTSITTTLIIIDAIEESKKTKNENKKKSNKSKI